MTKKRTPMMEQYEDIKARHKDELLFFRLGDFYELFFEDAFIASRELNIALTGRAAGMEDKAPMCGVPYHAAEGYIEKLIKKGYKVAICEQVEDPKEAKGIVKRDVIQVITPGTILSEGGMEERKNNFLALFSSVGDDLVLIFADVSTGEMIWEKLPAGSRISAVCDALTMYEPSEIIVANKTELVPEVQDFIDNQLERAVITPFTVTDSVLADAAGNHHRGEAGEEPVQASQLAQTARDHFSTLPLEDEVVLAALGCLLIYLRTVIRSEPAHMNYVHRLSVADHMILDTSSLKHLEISRNLRDGGIRGTLLQVLDRTLTPMGARLLKQWTEVPLTSAGRIKERQNAVGELIDNQAGRSKVRELLDSIFDFERILTRIETGSVSPRDFVSLRESLRILPALKESLSVFRCTALQTAENNIQIHQEIYSLLGRAIAEQPALTLRDGNVIRDGYSEELDELRSLATNSQEWLQRMEEEVKTRTGIRLKTGYNKVFGYYFEVSHANTAAVPDYFIRKQTLTNAERYITPELKEFEIKILSAKEKMVALEQKLYQNIRMAVREAIPSIQETARALARLDVFAGLAVAAYEERWICPAITMNGQIQIRDGRHPVIEKFLKREVFVPNDVVLNHKGEEFLLITGPNMAGKSTYMRQTAILVIMAQIGSYIPAGEASISPVDRIFTRVGASDDISTGQSTFMVEMKEVAYILDNATENSLVILDEIGRGTSTFDGLSIAQAVVEHIIRHIHAKTLFATHYHELIPLEGIYPSLKNYTVAVKEKGKDVAFLRRIIRGGADRSYGIHVARLAGLPASVLRRAEAVLAELEAAEPERAPNGAIISVSETAASRKADSAEEKGMNGRKASGSGRAVQAGSAGGLDLFSSSVIDELLAVDVMSLTPIEAINELYRLQEEARKGGGK